VKSLKILFITHKFYPDIGGIEVNSEILALAFHHAGHQVRLITWTSSTGDKAFPFQVIRQPGVAALFKEHRNAEVVFENNPSLRLSWPAVFFNKPIVVALRTWINRIEGGMAWQDKLKIHWLKCASAVIAVSDAVRKRCWPEATVIGNPYRQNLFRVLPDVQRTRDFVFMGRLVPDKGADIALKALHNLSTGTTSLPTLTIIGNGPEQEGLQELAKTLDVESQVNFTGSLRGEELVACLNQHRYLLVPSTWEEPFGNVALEGMACGCLPIVSNGGGLPDAVGNAGLVVERGNVDALTKGIQTLFNDTELEQQLRNAATTHLANHHPNVVSKKYLALVEAAATRSK
jgi:glycosyltransferase involved in cell wall biosynthesis